MKMRIDFTEIPPSNESGKTQDQWELFAAEFLEMIGYEIVSYPSRGPDGGKDLIVKELIHDTNEVVQWLISCKHYAFSGKSVTKTDELDIRDRLEKFNCIGFMGFYSTIPNGSLLRHLEDSKKNNKLIFKIFYPNEIERHITGNPFFENLFKRYFPSSFQVWNEYNPIPEPINLYKFYIEKTQNGFINNLLLEIFKTESNLMKCLRLSKNIDSFLSFAKVKWIHLEKFTDDRIQSDTSIWEIGNIMFERRNLELVNRRCALMGFTLYSVAILTEEYLIATDIWGEGFKEFYSKTKKTLGKTPL